MIALTIETLIKLKYNCASLSGCLDIEAAERLFHSLNIFVIRASFYGPEEDTECPNNKTEFSDSLSENLVLITK